MEGSYGNWQLHMANNLMLAFKEHDSLLSSITIFFSFLLN